MPINYNQQPNPNSDYSSLLDMLGRDREFINNHQQIEPSNRYKRMLQQELAYQAKENGLDPAKNDLLEIGKSVDYSPKLLNPDSNSSLIDSYYKAGYASQKNSALGNAENLNSVAQSYRKMAENRLGMYKNGEIPIGSDIEQSIRGNSNKTRQTSKETNENVKLIYNAFLKAGYTKNQALHLLEEVARENSFQTSLLLGTHKDPYNKATNMGLISWQGSRRIKLLNHLKAEGVMDSSGKWLGNKQDILDSQARFMMKEMKTSYKRTSKEFLNNPNVDRAISIRTLGEDYIGWRLNDRAYRAKGLNTMASWRNTLPKILGI